MHGTFIRAFVLRTRVTNPDGTETFCSRWQRVSEGFYEETRHLLRLPYETKGSHDFSGPSVQGRMITDLAQVAGWDSDLHHALAEQVPA